jgi:hypothetical protein
MFYRHRVEAQNAENEPNQNNTQHIYLEAYRYSLDLCENAEIAQKVASRFLQSMGMKEQSSSVFDSGKPEAAAFSAVAILC